LFGNKYVAPVINGGQGFVRDLDGLPITDSFGNNGFPSGFSPTPSQSLGYVAQMLEAGVDVVYFYIEDAHDNHSYPGCASSTDGTFGPGEAGYVCQLKAYDKAFGEFFARLKMHNITPDNTLFVITSDENDHFAGNVKGAIPPGCDGINVACTYPTGTKRAELSHQRQSRANCDRHPHARTESGSADRIRSDHQRRRQGHPSVGGSGRNGLPAHDLPRSEPHAELHPVR